MTEIFGSGDERGLKNAWLRQLAEEWKMANSTFFKNRMTPPLFELASTSSLLGRWEGGFRRTLTLSLQLIEKHPWEYVQEVLYHEMAHQYVEEVLKVKDDRPHGEAFRKICGEKGLDSSATGEIGQWVAGKKRGKMESAQGKILEKAHKLFALARSSNEHEAEVAMTKARELLLKYNLALMEESDLRHYVQRQVGGVGRRDPARSIIASILGTFFFVEAIWSYGYDAAKDKKGRVLELYGTYANVEMAAYAHDYLLGTSRALWESYQKREGLPGNRHRRTYVYGLLNGFYEKLSSHEKKSVEKGLVWQGDPQLKAYFRKRNPRINWDSCRYSSSSREVYRSGIEEGKKLTIHKGVEKGGGSSLRFLT